MSEDPVGYAPRTLTPPPPLTAEGLLTLEERVRCEIWTRVMGYHRPVSAWNAGKQAEHAARRLFAEDAAGLTHA